jgi:glycosyltransferase involved in cell wall biosynthesis
VGDDGRSDGTTDSARQHGVDLVGRLPEHRGLAAAFLAGLDAAIGMGADIVVNTDADNQYRGEDIPALVAPILEGNADIVVGTRPISATEHFSVAKKVLQRWGSRVTRTISGTDVEDAPSGFRAYTREAAKRLHVFNEYTYTIETIIQAGMKGMTVASVSVRTNPPRRSSRLVRSTLGYVNRQILTMMRIFMTYRPFRFFAVPGSISFLVGFAIGLRFLYFFLTDGRSGHVQSLILGALLMGIGFFLIVIGLVADLIAVNRKLLEDVDWRLKEIDERTRPADRTG